jgi:hypothetical protein
MQKTPLKPRYLSALAALNDQLCYSLFARNQLRATFENFNISDAGHLFLKSVFAKNHYAPKINIRIDQVQTFESEHERTSFGAYVSTSYETTASGYIFAALDLLQSTNAASFVRKEKKTPEDTYWNSLSASGCTTPAPELRLTLSYIRQRRNHFIHLGSSLTQTLTNLIQNQGSALNRYWRPTIRELDFTSTTVTYFGERESIDLLMLLRIVIQRLDRHLASQLPPGGVIELVTSQLFASQPSRINADVLSNRVSKDQFRAQARFWIHSPAIRHRERCTENWHTSVGAIYEGYY